MRTDGKVNGLRRDRGRVNGLVNGGGIVNGSGLVNGSGFVNGLSLRENPFGIVTHRELRRGAVLILASLFVLVVVGFLLSEPVPGRPFAADGDFGEWTGIPRYPDDLDPQLPGHADLRAYALHATEDWIFVYGRTEAALFPGTTPSSVFVLVDWTDSGYAAAPGFRADAIAELYGWDGVLQGTVTRLWTGGGDPDNATALRRAGTFPAATEGTEFEFALERAALSEDDIPDFGLVLMTSAGDSTDRGAIVGPNPGALVVTQRPLATIASTEGPVLQLTFRALVAPVTVGGLTYAQSGGGLVVLPTFPFTVAADGTRVEMIRLDPGALPSGRFLTVRVTDVDGSAAGRRINATVSGDAARLYVDNIPSGKTVDGLFGDWSSATPEADDLVPDSVDILASAAAIQAGAFFYLQTQGGVMTGALLPERPVPPIPGGTGAPGAPEPLPRQSGEDLLRVYVDTDDRDARGWPVAGIIADRLVEVRGRVGRITASAAYTWDASASRWRADPATVDAVFRGGELEGSVPASFLGATNNATVAFATSDWSGAGDATIPAGLRGTRGFGPGPLDGQNAQSVLATPLTNVPVVDGDCFTTGTEYEGSSTGSSTGVFFYIGRRSDFQYVYVCVRATLDSTSNAFDWGELLFDTGHNGQGTPQTDDRRFRVFSGSGSLGREKGDGNAWVNCDTDCDAGDIGQGAFTGGVEVYEFRIRFSDVWGTNSPGANQRAGFAIVVHDDDAGLNYAWGSDNVSDTAPNTWGHVDIPEFPALGVAVASILLPLLLRRQVQTHRRPRASRQRINRPGRMGRR